jgi:hypothetical protein
LELGLLIDIRTLLGKRFSPEGWPAVYIAQRLADRPAVVASRFLYFAILAFALCHSAQAQSAAEYSGTTLLSSGTTASMKPPKVPAAPSNKAPAASPHLAATSGPPPEESNRSALEASAGKDASKLLLRSTLTDSKVWINGKPVGKTPMLLILAPGKYEIEVVAADSTRTQSTVALLPRETRELTLNLLPRYRARVTLH